MDSSIHHDPFAPDKPALRFSDDSQIDPYTDAVGQDPAIADAQEQSAQELAPPHEGEGQGPSDPADPPLDPALTGHASSPGAAAESDVVVEDDTEEQDAPATERMTAHPEPISTTDPASEPATDPVVEPGDPQER